MIHITVSQMKNSIELEKNFSSILKTLALVENSNTDVVLFPECALSGFSSKMKECTPDRIKPYLDKVENWSRKTNKHIILPTALYVNQNDNLNDNKIYNTGYIFGLNKREQFFKIGLTDSEKKFFSKPKIETSKVFRIKGYNFALLICYEAQMDSYSLFKEGEADIILWPGYWGWEKGASWQSTTKDDKPQFIYQNMENWKVPLIQSNFSFNDLGDNSAKGPHGLSMFVNSDNKLFSQGEYDKEACYKISINSKHIIDFIKLGDL